MDAVYPQTILAYEMNDRPLPVANDAPMSALNPWPILL